MIVGAWIGLYALGYYDPLPESAPESGGVFLYYGPEGETVPEPGINDQNRTAADAALGHAAYYGAFATGPQEQTGVWTGAWTSDLARAHALAMCGPDCRVVAERVPRHRDPERTEPVATAAMARNLGVKWPFTNDYIAIGGAGAWGHRSKPAGKTGWKTAMRDAAADCEARRAAEAAPAADLSSPCRVQPLHEIEDLRPKPQLYPANFEIALTDLVPLAGTRLVKLPDAPQEGWVTPYKPDRLHGTRAANGDTTYHYVRAAGWPEAGAHIAHAKCNAGRRPAEDPCVLSHRVVPNPAPSGGGLAVTPELYEAFAAWDRTGGAGALS